MTAQELREKYLKFFESKGHTIIPSASLIPEGTDPTVLFNTAGMQQFKAYYLNPDEATGARVATSQKCVRTIDIDEVGDNTHLTFFEMLGNFSFGYPNKEKSYFKREALQYAWEFLTEVLKIDRLRIYATYFKGENGVSEDTESLEILKTIDGLGDIRQQGFGDNFWSLGTENSPGGPTVEFYVDGIEVWNCVFNEYVFKSGRYEKSENKGVDTGMGLERLLMVMEGKNNVYETDLLTPIIRKIEEVSGKKYEFEKGDLGFEEMPDCWRTDMYSMRIIADHLKAATFLISDGVVPSNTQQGYILRRLIRRAIRYGHILGVKDNFTTKIANIVIEIYKDAYFSESDKSRINIYAELEKEENKFRETLEKGLKEFDKLELKIKADYEQNNNWDYMMAGKCAFNLYQTYGFPIEMFFEELDKRNISYIDDKEKSTEEFKKELKKHQELSRTASAGMFKGGLADAGEATAKLHTATHLLLAALRQILGEETYQKGSNITVERLRFDFNYPQKLTPEQIKQVEDLVNAKIRENLPVEMTEMPKDEALKIAKVSFDPSKYGDIVKVYKIGNFSVEVCGGPHAKATGELGHFQIKKEEASSAGVRRIKAVLE